MPLPWVQGGREHGAQQCPRLPRTLHQQPQCPPCSAGLGLPLPSGPHPRERGTEEGSEGPTMVHQAFFTHRKLGGGVWPSLSLGGTERCRVLSGEPPLWGSWGSRVALRSSPVASEPLGWKLAPWGSHGVASRPAVEAHPGRDGWRRPSCEAVTNVPLSRRLSLGSSNTPRR